MSLKIYLFLITTFGARISFSTSELNVKCVKDYFGDTNLNKSEANSSAINKDVTNNCLYAFHMCLRQCSTNFVSSYNNQPNAKTNFVKTISFTNGTTREFHLLHDFHQIVKNECQNISILEANTEQSHRWHFYKNKTKLSDCFNICPRDTEYCFNVEPNMYHKPGKAVSANGYASIFSLPFFILTIVLYATLQQLKNCHGKCFIAYLSCLSLSYILKIFLFFKPWLLEPFICSTVGFLLYYSGIAYAVWTGVISYHSWKMLTQLGAKSSLRKYSLVGWLLPLFFTIITYIVQISPIKEKFKPGIQHGHCAVNYKRWTCSVYYGVPFMIVLFFNIVLYIKVRRYIAGIKRDASIFRDENEASHWKRSYDEFRLFIYTGLYLLSTITIINVAAMVRLALRVQKPSFGVPDLFNALQGPFILLLLISRPTVRKELRTRLMGRKTDELLYKGSRSGSSTC